MKRYLYCLCICLGVFWAKAQEPEYETLFNRKTNKDNRDLRMYATLMTFYSPIRINENRIGNPNLAAEIGLSYKRKFSFGLSGQTVGTYVGLINNNQAAQNGVVGVGEMPIFIQYLGGVFSYTNSPGKMIHSHFRLFFGDLYYSELDMINPIGLKGSFVNPNAGIEFNLLPYLTVRSDLGYRFAFLQNSMPNIKNIELSGLIGSISIKIGNIR
jgi:hypothetical protein